MQHDKIVCLDIETVPDRTLIPDWDDGKFPPKPIWHQVVAICFVEARINQDNGLNEQYAVTCCRSGGDSQWHEQRLLSKFWQYFDEYAPRVVTWNGKGFDLPVLRVRAMMHGISAHSWYRRGTKWDNYMQRFAPDWHCDLMEQLSDYKASASMKLDDIALALGLPGKIGGHGSGVEAMVRSGDIDKVRAYCEGDCLNLFVLYVRWALLSGRTDPSGHNASLENLIECLEKERGARPHLGAFLDGWRATNRPTSMFVPCGNDGSFSRREPSAPSINRFDEGTPPAWGGKERDRGSSAATIAKLSDKNGGLGGQKNEQNRARGGGDSNHVDQVVSGQR